MSTVSKYRVLKRFARVGDVVQVKSSGNLYDVVEVDKTPGRIEYVVESFYDASSVNGFRASEVDVIAKRDADELREERAAAQRQDAVSYVAKSSQRRLVPFAVDVDEPRRPRDLDMSDVYADAARMRDEQTERELDLIDATPVFIVSQATQTYRENKLHDKRCLAAALVSAIENLRDSMPDQDFRLAVQDGRVLVEADAYLLSGLQTCSCDDAAARHAFVLRACEDYAAEQSAR